MASPFDCARPLASADIVLLAGNPLRERFWADFEAARSTLHLMTADLKLAQMGRRRDLVDVLLARAAAGVTIEILASSTTGPFRERLAVAGAADVPGLSIRLCPRNHAKAMIADDAVVYVGSGNLTGKGLGLMASADSINIEAMIRAGGAKAVELAIALRQDIWHPAWTGALCESCRWKKRGRCDGLLDKFQILDLGPA